LKAAFFICSRGLIYLGLDAFFEPEREIRASGWLQLRLGATRGHQGDLIPAGRLLIELQLVHSVKIG
jgi:hypothetical protein